MEFIKMCIRDSSCGEEIIYLMFTLEEKLGYTFKNKALLENALQHSSYANRCV